MAKQIIILETNPSDGGQISIRAALWFPIAAGKEVPLPNATSAWTGRSAGDLTNLQNGTVLEEVKVFQFPSGTSIASLKASILAAWTARKAYLDAQPFQGQYYGVFYDSSTAWSA